MIPGRPRTVSMCRRGEDTDGPQQPPRLQDAPGSFAASHYPATAEEIHQVPVASASTSDSFTLVSPRPIALSTSNDISLEALFPYVLPSYVANQSQAPPLQRELTSLRADHDEAMSSDRSEFQQEVLYDHEDQDGPQHHSFEPHDFYDGHPQDTNWTSRQQYLEHQYYEEYDHQMDYEDEPGFIDDHQRARLELLNTIESALEVVVDCDERDHQLTLQGQQSSAFHHVGAHTLQ